MGGSEETAWRHDGNGLHAAVGDPSGLGTILTAPFTPQIGTWYHIAYTFDDISKSQALFLNGTILASGLGNKSIGYDTHAVTIGAEFENENLTFFFAGLIDEVEIFNRALDAEEIEEIFEAGSAGKCKDIEEPDGDNNNGENGQSGGQG